jgi:hypothetical protein
MINHTWRARLIRLWLVIGVPLACWSAYEAWDAFQKISFWDGQIESWRVRLADQEKKGFNHGMVDPYKSLMESMDYRTQSAERANNLTLIAAALMAMPVIGVIILKIFEWVWAGPSQTRNIEKSAPSSRSWRNLATSDRVRWGLGIGGLLVFTGIMYAFRPESTTTTLIQVLVQVGVLGVVLALIKFFRR